MIDLLKIGRISRKTARKMSQITTQQKNKFLALLAEQLKNNAEFILAANQADIEQAQSAGMTAALTWRMPSHPKMREWAEKALSLARSSPNIEASTRAYTNNAVYQIWMGGFDECGLLIKEMERMVASRPVSPLRSIVLKHTEAMFYNTSAVFREEAICSVSAGLGEAQRTGVYVSNPLLYNQGVVSALNQGDPGRAEEFLARLEKTLRSGSRTHTGHYL